MRFWIEMLAIASAIACSLSLLFVTLGVASAEKAEPGQPAQSPAVQLQTYEGMITDTHCGAKHSAAAGRMADDCTLVCIRNGERFSLVDGDRNYVLEGEPAALKRVAGQRVRIMGSLRGKTISVQSVAAGL